MEATIRAVCPSCRSPLRIPARWVGKSVKCKKCGAVVRARAKHPGTGMAEAAPADGTAAQGFPVPVVGGTGTAPVPQPVPFELDDDPEPYPPVAQPIPYPYPYAAPPAYAPAADYPYPAPPVIEVEPETLPFAPSEHTQAYQGRGRYRQGQRGGGRWAWAVLGLMLAAGLVTAGVLGAERIRTFLDTLGNDPPDQTQTTPPPAPPAVRPSTVTGSAAFPRRLLFIHVSKYVYLNPLTGTQPDGAAARRLAYEWRVPTEKDNNQLFILSDTAPPPNDTPPMRSVIVGAYEKFFETSRPQDRIAVYFGGHVLEKDGKAFLVPVEGDPEDPATLIPLDEFYAKLAACKATQKVVLWDVCRFNFQRGRQRPGSEPMSEKLAQALAVAPAGVQVVIACQPGENALEFNGIQVDNTRPSGSNFLEAARVVAEKNLVPQKNPTAADPLPAAAWAEAIGKRVEEVATTVSAEAGMELRQTVKITGAAPGSLVAIDEKEKPAARFELPPAPRGASVAEIEAVKKEFNLPAIFDQGNDSGFGAVPFPANVMRDYAPDVSLEAIKKDPEKYRFRVTVLNAFKMMNDLWDPTGRGDLKFRKEFTDKTSDAVKKQILQEQEFPAKVIPRLEILIAELKEIAPLKADEPKRWQAHYDYALGQAKARLAFMQEYNLLLGNIRTDSLPELDPKKGHDGYKLVTAETMKSKKDVQTLADEAREHFTTVITAYKGTPWAVQAKRDRAFALGLAWQPFSSKPPDKDKD